VLLSEDEYHLTAGQVSRDAALLNNPVQVLIKKIDFSAQVGSIAVAVDAKGRFMNRPLGFL